MNWIKTFTAVVATLGMSAVAQAGFFNLSAHCGAAKSCGCAPSCQPVCCKPTITRPCGVSVHTYQRKVSDIKPPCCNVGCVQAPQCCAPAPKACAAPAPQVCAPAPKACAAPAPQVCAPAPKVCAAPRPQACAPAPRACAAPGPQACGPHPQACGPRPQACCGPVRCCTADPCEIAQLIYQSQTACYARDRRKAIHKLGDDFDCICNPEIMCAMVYALNDADERVRAKAADEIGDQLRKNPCCCSPEVVSALTCALGDCDKWVRRQAEEALEICGYEIVDGCCQVACGSMPGCGPCGMGGPAAAPAPAPAPAPEAAPAPAPPTEDPKAYFPSRLNHQQTGQKTVKRNPLSRLFGLLD